jgi:hypothetical protein
VTYSRLVQACRRACVLAILVICYLVLVNVLTQLFKVTAGLLLSADWPFVLAALPAALVPFIYAAFRWAK